MSTTTLYLAQLFAPAALVVGVALLMNGEHFKKFIHGLKDPLVAYLAGVAALVSCTALLLAHNVWTPDAAGLITLIGWAGVIKGALLILIPDQYVAFARSLTESTALFVFGGVVWLALGGYFAYVGYSV